MPQKFGTRRELAKQETRRVIRETAYTLFEEKGFQKTTMRELASKAGVGLGTIFQHFPDKPSLLVAAFEEELGGMVKKGLSSLPKDGTIKEQLFHIVRPILVFYAKRPKLSRVLIKEVFFLEGKAARKIDELEADLSAELAGLFFTAMERGEIDPKTNVQDAVVALWAYYSLMLLHGLRAEVFDVDALLEQLGRLLDQHVNGLRLKGKSSDSA
jgi:AcrR family transcriptional regulator